MSRKCQAEECFLCKSNFLGWRHRRAERWSLPVAAFLEGESRLNVGNKNLCVCCVPSCSSVDIKAEKHDFTWEVI